jgi:hypothetical protein
MSTPISPKLLTDAIVASYIHDISTRHGAEDPAAEDRAITQCAGERVSAPAGS